jgi:type I restriction enzyme S subunit
MPDDWKTVPLGELYEFSSGLSKPRAEFGFGHGFLSFKDVFYNYFAPPRLAELVNSTEKEQQSCSILKGDVFLTRTSETMNELGMSCVALEDYKRATFNGFTKRLRPKRTTNIVPEYAGYYFRSPTFRREVTAMSSMSTRASLNNEMLGRLKIVLPPVETQSAIGSILKSLDDKIELNRRMNATLEAMARALFQSWFVDFDPVRAKLDGRQPPGLDPAIAALFPKHFEHTEDGLLPLGWRHAAIEEVCGINAWTLGRNDQLETLEYVEISEVSRGNIANIATYKRGEEPSRARRRLRHGDTVLSTVRPDRGSYFLALNPRENRVASTGFTVLTPTKVPWSFVHAAMTQPEVSEHLGLMADGGAYPAVRPEVIGAMPVALPDGPTILDAFHRICAPFFEQAEGNRIQSRTLATARDILLPKLISGEIRAGDELLTRNS